MTQSNNSDKNENHFLIYVVSKQYNVEKKNERLRSSMIVSLDFTDTFAKASQ